MGVGGFERRLERLVEGTMNRMFRSSLQPVELGRRVQREMDSGRKVGVGGRAIVPNHFEVRLHPSDLEAFAEIEVVLRRDLCDMARAHAHDEGATLMGPVEVELVPEPDGRAGMFEVVARFREGPGGGLAAELVLPTGDRVPLGEYELLIGRSTDCHIVLADPNASRRHAVVAPDGDGFVVNDLGSSNGTRVNGVRVSRHRLIDGDELRFGQTVMRFEVG